MFRRGEHRHRVVIGKDTRLSGYMIETALVAGFTSVGMDVLLLGPMPTPAVAMLTRSMRADLGVMISASHNPFDDNGIKLFGPDGYKLSDDVEHKIEALIDTDMTKRLAKSAELGRAKRIDGVHDRYIEFAKRTMPRNLSLDGLRVVIDCANGAAYRVAPDALWELGADVVSIGVEPDGFNINRECGSTAPDALSRKVREMRADIGIALDGDADRVVIADEHGHLVDGDQLLAVIAESWARRPLAHQARHRRHRDVESRPRAASAIAQSFAGPHAGRRPLRARTHARARLQCRRRTVRPHHPVQLHHDRRRLHRRAAIAGGGEERRTSRYRRSATASSRCRRSCATCATAAASRWRTPKCARRSPTPRSASTATAAW